MEFLTKINENPYTDLYFNIPEEQKIGMASVIGGNGQNFRTVIKAAEFMAAKFPLKELKVVLPDSLKSKLPPLDNLVFLKTTDVGSFDDKEGLKAAIDAGDFSLIIGDLSKNAVTKSAFESAFNSSEKPLILTRDTVDLLAEMKLEKILMREDLTIFGSVPQWQKIFKNVYYPKMLMMTQPLVQVAEAFHKFTLSYPVQVVTLHDEQIIIAKNGRVFVVPLAKSGYSPLTIWNGELAGKIMVLNLFNPDKFLEATVAALFFR